VVQGVVAHRQRLGGVLELTGLVLAIAAMLGFKRLAHREFERDRTPLPFADIHRTVQDQISIGVFNEVWSKLGESFSIDPKLIRPNDKLKSLADLDSWDLGRGEDALTQWLAQRNSGTPPALDTVLDLARWVETSASGVSRSATSS
jgi:hypothetical protein